MEAAPVLSVDAKRREEIERHVKALQSGDGDAKEAAVEELESLAGKNAANRAGIVEAGALRRSWFS